MTREQGDLLLTISAIEAATGVTIEPDMSIEWEINGTRARVRVFGPSETVDEDGAPTPSESEIREALCDWTTVELQ